MEGKVQFKAYVYWKDQLHPEVRRFEVEKSFATKFTYLVVKLQMFYPALKQKRYIISWKDEEGDNVTISSYEEMTIALSSMTDNVMKLNVYFADTKLWQNDCDVAITATSNSFVLKPKNSKCPITPPEETISSQVTKTVKEKMSSSQTKTQLQQLQLESDHIILKPKEPEHPTPPEKNISSHIAQTVNAQLPQVEAESHHNKPHIDKAIKQMLAMGFTDNDGWLTQLLEMTNGDIVPVIELLTPATAK